MGRKLRDLLLLTLIPLCLFLVLAEVGLRVYLRGHTFYDVEMSRYARTLKVDSENPLIGHVHRPSATAQLMNTTVRINSDGFRDDEYALERNERRRIIFLGDSLTFGWGVEKEESFEHRLEHALDASRPTEIINFAAGNYNTVQQVNLFLEKGLRYEPDQVVIFYFINDAEPVPQRSRFPWLGSSRIVTFYWSRVKALLSRIGGAPDFYEYYAALYREGAEGWRNSQAALLALQEACLEHAIALQVVLLPELHQLEPYTFAEEHAIVARFLRSHGIPVLDLAPRLAGQQDPHALWVALDDAHPNAEAHRLIAEHSQEFIAEARVP